MVSQNETEDLSISMYKLVCVANRCDTLREKTEGF